MLNSIIGESGGSGEDDLPIIMDGEDILRVGVFDIGVEVEFCCCRIIIISSTSVEGEVSGLSGSINDKRLHWSKKD